MNKPLALLAALVLLAGCATAPRPRFDYDPSADFAQYRTFGFVEQPGTDRNGYSTLITVYFKNAVTREMEARGYTLSQNNPDLLLNFSASERSQTDVRSSPAMMSMGLGYYSYRYGMYSAWPMYPMNDVDTVHYKVGTTNVDVVDARRKQLVWEGRLEGRLTEAMMQNPSAAIDSAVTTMFTQYPARAGVAAVRPATK
ncbi:MAG: DUF4136 domain-containing protein [Nevskiaceae bacterium]|nr:DUF4136 domain-containing protein [Nevskiaceae bacterium]